MAAVCKCWIRVNHWKVNVVRWGLVTCYNNVGEKLLLCSVRGQRSRINTRCPTWLRFLVSEFQQWHMTKDYDLTLQDIIYIYKEYNIRNFLIVPVTQQSSKHFFTLTSFCLDTLCYYLTVFINTCYTSVLINKDTFIIKKFQYIDYRLV